MSFPLSSTSIESPPIALALSGGGARAMAFHYGVLTHLAERGALERVAYVSTVSGGSLFVGLLLKNAGYHWPSSAEYLRVVRPRLRNEITRTNLQWAATKMLMSPPNWRFALSRANVVAQAIRSTWGITVDLTELPRSPVWFINATTAETGRRTEFVGNLLSDWKLGAVRLERFALASAMAVSAAFPGGIGPLVMETAGLPWRRPPFSEPDSGRVASERFRKIHLYDGGVYDNLGIEPFFDAGYRSPKKRFKGATLLVADAGAPLTEGFDSWSLSPWRLKRIADIMSEQSRALRVRGFVAHAKLRLGSAGYMRIGQSVSAVSKDFRVPPPLGYWQSDEDVALAASYPTNLKRIPMPAFERIARHGAEAAAVCDHVFKCL